MLEHLFNWGSVGEFVDKVGVPMTVWFVTIFLIYKFIYGFGIKLWDRFGPVIDAHFELVTSMKDNLSKQTFVMQQTNDMLEEKFSEQTKVLNEIKQGQGCNYNTAERNGIKR